VCVGGLTTRAEREHTAVAYNCIVGGALTPTAIDVYAQYVSSTPVSPVCTEQTSTTHRLEGPFQHQPSQRPHAALCCMRQHSTHPSTSTVISALCLRQRSAAAPTPAPHRVLSATPRLSQSINTHTVHQYTTTCGSRSGGLRRFPPNHVNVTDHFSIHFHPLRAPKHQQKKQWLSPLSPPSPARHLRLPARCAPPPLPPFGELLRKEGGINHAFSIVAVARRCGVAVCMHGRLSCALAAPQCSSNAAPPRIQGTRGGVKRAASPRTVA
jgi:hypothetical protein